MFSTRAPNKQELRLQQKAFDSTTRESLPRACWAVGALLAGRCLFHLSYEWSERTLLLAGSAAFTSVLILAYGWLLRRGWLSGRSANVLVLIGYLAVLAETLVPPALNPRPSQYVTIAFSILGAGCVFLSRRLLACAIVCTLLGWVACTGSLWGELKYARLTFIIVGAAGVSVAIHEMRRAALMRLVRMHVAAVESQRAAEQANRAKSQFLANTNHELRTPLAAILGYAEALESRMLDPDEAARAIVRNAEHLMELVTDTLDLARIESGRLDVEQLAFSPRTLVDDVVTLTRITADEKGLPLRTDVDEAVPEVAISDPTRLRQILVNLLSNAIKFTERGEVAVHSFLEGEEDDRRLVFEIIDTGIGIDDDQIEHIFDAFRQGDASTTRRYGGTGLGLAISRRLAERLDATLDATSKLGFGSTFRLAVPLVRASEPTHREPSGTAAGKTVNAESLAGIRVLVAEDCPDIQRLMLLLLRKAGAEVVVVENGRLAVDRATTPGEQFDVVLMDLQMPELDGMLAVRALRATGYEGAVIAATANTLDGEGDRCRAAGFDDYATKPIRPRELIALVRKWAAAERPHAANHEASLP